MIDVMALLERQATWQESLRDLSWSEKVRMAEKLRESVVELRRSKPPSTAPASATRPASTESRSHKR